MNVGILILLLLLGLLLTVACRARVSLDPIIKRLIEQLIVLVPRTILALIVAGFVATLIPEQLISDNLGADSGLLVLPIAALAGLLVPSGPVIAFAIAAVLVKSGSSNVALVTFLTSWSIFAAHRILIYEIPLLGVSFLRMRIVSVLFLPFLAGILAMIAGFFTGIG